MVLLFIHDETERVGIIGGSQFRQQDLTAGFQHDSSPVLMKMACQRVSLCRHHQPGRTVSIGQKPFLYEAYLLFGRTVIRVKFGLFPVEEVEQ